MIDLHIHTTATPGHASWSPESLAAAAVAQGIHTIAVTDHNTTAGVVAVAVAGARYGIRVIAGVELDTTFGGKLWHTLIYGANPAAAELLALCEEVFQRNTADAQRLLHTLREQGFRIELPVSADRSANVAEVATALAQANHLPDRVAGEGDEEAGMRFILTTMAGSYQPLGVDEVIDVAHRLNGLAVLAHPGRSKGIYAIPAETEEIAAMAAAGLDGIEVYYPTHSPAQVELYRALALNHGLLISGGSDSHHPYQPLARLDQQLVSMLNHLRA